jgi:predicted nucleotidyltransferase
MRQERELNELVERLKRGAGENLRCVVLFGSAATEEFHARHSDLNVLCVLARLGASDIRQLSPSAIWWEKRGHAAPLLFTLEELRRSADVFAIELLDIKAHRRLLYGDDLLQSLPVPTELHRLQVKHELRASLIRLRQRFLAARTKNRVLLDLMTASVGTFLALFRHALIALGDAPPENNRAALANLSAKLGFDRRPFETLLEVREGKRKRSQLDVPGTMRTYLASVERVADEVDRRLGGPPKLD